LIKYCKLYIKTYYEHFKFFKPECMDNRIREVMMRKNLCLECPGINRCRMHPEFWMEGEEDRAKENERMIREFPDQGELSEIPEDITENLGAIEIKQDLAKLETRLGV